MSHKNKESLSKQSEKVMLGLQCLGRKKNEDKKAAAEEWKKLDEAYKAKNGKKAKYPTPKWEYINNAIRDKIYGINTYKAYAKCTNRFFDWCKANYPRKQRETLAQVREYVPIWLEMRVNTVSSSTVKTEAAALGKLYQCDYREFGVKLPERKSIDAKRSRNVVARDKGFSLENNKDLIEFCRCTGLRRFELESLCSDQLELRPDGSYGLVIKGKGGRIRHSPIIGSPDAVSRVVERIKSSDGFVWGAVNSHMDVHSYRAEYATAIYLMYERPFAEIPYDGQYKDGRRYKKQVYYCRSDRNGMMFDKVAMKHASEALGHSRLNVVAEHYLRVSGFSQEFK